MYFNKSSFYALNIFAMLFTFVVSHIVTQLLLHLFLYASSTYRRQTGYSRCRCRCRRRRGRSMIAQAFHPALLAPTHSLLTSQGHTSGKQRFLNSSRAGPATRSKKNRPHSRGSEKDRRLQLVTRLGFSATYTCLEKAGDRLAITRRSA